MGDDQRGGIDRRNFALGLALVLTAACNTGAASKGHAHSASTFWTQWRDRFVAPDGRVVDTGNGGISHSEGQSYGLILAHHAGDRDAFERIFAWTEANLARQDLALYSWRYDPRATNAVSDPNNATDGDIVIAWALALAGERWKRPDWLGRSHAIRRDIRSHCVLSRYGRNLLLPGLVGFVETDRVILNPSYFVWPALDHFARLDGAAAWGGVIADCEDLTQLSRFGAHGLPADWIAVTGSAQVAPAPDKPPRFGYDAVRVGLYAAVGHRASLAAPIRDWWKGCLDARRPIPAWVDVTNGEEANYPLSSGGAAIAARLVGTAAPPALEQDYFAASLQMLAQL